MVPATDALGDMGDRRRASVASVACLPGQGCPSEVLVGSRPGEETMSRQLALGDSDVPFPRDEWGGVRG